MPKLSDFSIESDQRVHLRFSDGTKSRVVAEDLPRYLTGNDLTRVMRALRVRQHYISKMLPPWARIVLVGTATAALVWLQSGPVASWRGLQPVKAARESDEQPGQPLAPSRPQPANRQAVEPNKSPVKPRTSSDDELSNLIESASSSVNRLMNPKDIKHVGQGHNLQLKGHKK